MNSEWRTILQCYFNPIGIHQSGDNGDYYKRIPEAEFRRIVAVVAWEDAEGVTALAALMEIGNGALLLH